MSTTTVEISGDVVTPAGVVSGKVTVENGVVSDIVESESGGGKCWVFPGLIDIHNHGCGGAAEVSEYWNNPGYTLRYLAREGTTGCLASLVIGEDMDKVGETVEILTKKIKCEGDEARLLGIHAEGPLVADLGGLPKNSVNAAEFERFTGKMKECCKVMTVSPSKISENPRVMEVLNNAGVRLSLGHDRGCTLDQIESAVRGAKLRPHLTHLFNVMTFSHKQGTLPHFGLLREVKTDSGPLTPPTVEIIADNIHLHPLTVDLVLQSRLPTDIAIITDCVSENTPHKETLYNGRSMIVSPHGGCYLKGTNPPTLAGSSATLFSSLKYLVTQRGLPITDAAKLFSTTPAKVAQVDDEVGAIEVGKKADLILIEKKSFTLRGVMVGGRWVKLGDANL